MSNLILGSDLPDFLRTSGVSELTKQLGGGGGSTGGKRIVPKNGIFRLVVGGDEMGKVKGDLNAIIVNASPEVGRIFYATAWSPDADPTAPDCFSNDGRKPDEKASNPQAKNCNDCPNNVKGSGMGQSKACRYTRRIAVLLEQDFGTNLEGEVYQMNLASKSLFGENVGDSHTFENYHKYLRSHGKSVDYVVSRISFNEDNDNQSVLFDAARYINGREHEVVQTAGGSEPTKAMVLMNFSSASAKALPAPVTQQKDAEPVKRPSTKRAEPDPTDKKSLADVVSAWSSEGQ